MRGFAAIVGWLVVLGLIIITGVVALFVAQLLWQQTEYLERRKRHLERHPNRFTRRKPMTKVKIGDKTYRI